MVLLNALAYLGWTFLNGSLLFFGVLNINQLATNDRDSFVFPLQQYMFVPVEEPVGPVDVTTPAPPVTVPVTTPEVTTPEVTTPEVTTPEVTTPEVTTPGIDYSPCGLRSPGRGTLRSDESKFLSINERLYSDNLQMMRIIGGRNTNDGEWPWIAYLFEKPNGIDKGGLCGASLINSKWLVTAAHCFPTEDPSLYRVVLGEYNRMANSGFEIYRDVKRLILHEKYNTITSNNDVALVLLSKEVNFNEFVRPVCLVKPGTRTDANEVPTFAGMRLCTTIGWGITDALSEDRTLSDILQQVNVRILPKKICTSFTSDEQKYPKGQVIENHAKFCAGGNSGEDTCSGDSGGPLLCKHDDGRFYLHGITSYGSRVCGQQAQPGVFTKVADVAKWIDARMEAAESGRHI